MPWPLRLLTVLALGVALGAVSASSPQPSRIPLPSGEGRAMHLATLVPDSDVLRKAVIRGDLDEARAAARRLVAEPGKPAEVLPSGDAPAEAFREAARAIADAPDLERVARGMARLAAACGDCHRTANIHSALRTAAPPRLGGVVGHMLEHQQAADQMHAGLVEPSDPLWRRGAETLTVAPLKKDKLPRDSGLTDAVYAAEKRAHELGAEAIRASTPEARVDVYGRFLGSCAECHRLHAKIWGPGIPR